MEKLKAGEGVQEVRSNHTLTERARGRQQLCVRPTRDVLHQNTHSRPASLTRQVLHNVLVLEITHRLDLCLELHDGPLIRKLPRVEINHLHRNDLARTLVLSCECTAMPTTSNEVTLLPN